MVKIPQSWPTDTMANHPDFKEMLISAVQGWPCVYDKRRKDFKDNVKKTNAWEAIGFQCCADGKYILKYQIK